MNLTLKNVKYFKAGSEETPNFVADLYDNNIYVAEVRNNGGGGCNYLTPPKGKTYRSVSKYGTIDVECAIFGLVYDYDDVTKHQSNSLVMKKGDKICTTKFKMSISKMKKDDKGIVFLNNTIKKYESEGFIIMNRNL
jgi:hypothetical protein